VRTRRDRKATAKPRKRGVVLPLLFLGAALAVLFALGSLAARAQSLGRKS